jgi:hypothetical protein
MNHADLPFAFGNGQTKTIAYDGPGHNVPKLRDVLMRVMKSRTLSAKSSKSRISEFMLGIGTSGNAEQDVRVDQTRGDSHLVVILVNPFP